MHFQESVCSFFPFLVYSTTPNRPDRFWAPFGLLLVFNRYRVSFSLVKRAGLEAYHLSPSIARVTNEWSYTSTPSPTYIYGIPTEKLPFTGSVAIASRFVILFTLYPTPSQMIPVIHSYTHLFHFCFKPFHVSKFCLILNKELSKEVD
jgi:hypothetical protein